MLAKIELNYYLDIGIYLNIVKYSNIIKCILKNVKLNMRGGNQKASEKRYIEDLVGFHFLIIKPGSVLQIGAIKRLLKLLKK